MRRSPRRIRARSPSTCSPCLTARKSFGPTIACRAPTGPRSLRVSPSISAFLLLRKGIHASVDSYSAFLEADRKTTTGLGALLAARGVGRVFVCGLATDFCVAFTALDARAAGFETIVVEDACRAIDADGSLSRGLGAHGRCGRATNRVDCASSLNTGVSGDLTAVLTSRRSMTAAVVHRLSSARIAMITLYHHPFCPHSRFIRLVLAEYGSSRLVEERRGTGARVPAAQPGGRDARADDETRAAVPGADVIAESLDETRGLALGDRRLLPEDPLDRVEVRRLMHWFNVKFFSEATLLVPEKIYKRFMSTSAGGRRTGHGRRARHRTNMRYHLRYIGRLAAAAMARWRPDVLCRSRGGGASVERGFSGRRAWAEDETAKIWYAR